MKQHPLALDHVAIAVTSIAEAVPIYQSLTGGKSSPPERVESQGVEVVFIGQGTGRIELLQPIRADSPVERFLTRRGPGLHHLAYRVPDLPAALEEARRSGFRLIDEEPRPGAHGTRVAFLHPSGTGGVLIELVEG